MTYSEPARTTTRRIPRVLVAGLLVVIAAIAAGLGSQLLASSSSPAASPIAVLRSEHRGHRWVATAETSAHVSGDAVDIEHFDATAWLSEHGADYGLCQIYSNEPWHYELRPEAIVFGCPPMYADPTHDPRMQQ
jgi:hypothetical protein